MWFLWFNLMIIDFFFFAFYVLRWIWSLWQGFCLATAVLSNIPWRLKLTIKPDCCFPARDIRQRKDKEFKMVNSDIAGFYRDRSIFITGATGFMGKVLVEKLLRCCPSVKTLYLLMRPKSGNDIRTRLEELISTKVWIDFAIFLSLNGYITRVLLTQVFDNLRRDSPELINKLVPIAGDMSLPSLGVSASDTKILSDNVSIVFHSAATVKFDEALKSAVEMNLKGTMRLIELCRKMDRLDVNFNIISLFFPLHSNFNEWMNESKTEFIHSFSIFDILSKALVHVSTAYANCDKEEIAEMIYPPPADPHRLMECVDWMDEELLKSITKKYLNWSSSVWVLISFIHFYGVYHDAGW